MTILPNPDEQLQHVFGDMQANQFMPSPYETGFQLPDSASHQYQNRHLANQNLAHLRRIHSDDLDNVYQESLSQNLHRSGSVHHTLQPMQMPHHTMNNVGQIQPQNQLSQVSIPGAYLSMTNLQSAHGNASMYLGPARYPPQIQSRLGADHNVPQVQAHILAPMSHSLPSSTTARHQSLLAVGEPASALSLILAPSLVASPVHGVVQALSHTLVPAQTHNIGHGNTNYLHSGLSEDPSLMDSLSGVDVLGALHTSLPQLGNSLSPENHGISHSIDSSFEGVSGLRTGSIDVPGAKTPKVAPRCKDLFRVGPPFGSTQLHRLVYCGATAKQVIPELQSRIDRGFELGEAGNWIGYKRNYFTMVLTFTFQNWDLSMFAEHQFYLVDETDSSRRLPVKYFALGVVAKCSDPGVSIGLVQHTPKRDKGPQYEPPVYPAVLGGELPDHLTVKASCNKRNQKKIQTLRQIFGFDRDQFYQEHNVDGHKFQSILRGYPEGSIARVARFERLQFTASIRVKQPNNNKTKYFTLNAELLAFVEDGDDVQPVTVASCASAPLLVRGRSPSKYPKEKTSGYRDAEAVYTE